MSSNRGVVRSNRAPINANRVPIKQWRKWSPDARAVFNRVYEFVHDNPRLMTHPKMEKVAPAHWKTIAWNSAWIAADAVMDQVPTEVIDIPRRRAA